MLPSAKKFEDVDLPLILVALHKAQKSGMYAEVVVKFSHEGGCLEVKTQYSEKIK
jgi:hypothetical protein